MMTPECQRLLQKNSAAGVDAVRSRCGTFSGASHPQTRSGPVQRDGHPSSRGPAAARGDYESARLIPTAPATAISTASVSQPAVPSTGMVSAGAKPWMAESSNPLPPPSM